MKISNKLSYAIISCPLWWWLLLLSSVAVPPVYSGPLNIEGPSREVANNSLTDFDLPSLSKGCRYKALFYSNGEEVSTDEPCLACQCKGTVVVCKLRICAEIPVPPPPGCIVVHKAKSCCSHLVCHHGQEGPKKISREQRFPVNISNETLLASVSNETKDSAGYCVLDGTVYAEGSAMRSSTLCEYCFCIRGEMKCSSPQCVIPLNGCKPKFRSYACCPTNYDCGQSNETAILKTVPSSTQVPQFLKGCLVNNQFVPEGEPVLPVQLAGGFGNSSTNICQTCFCMGGVVHCRPLECDQPIDGCSPIKQVGHCCPDRYDCSKPAKQKSMSTAPTTKTTGYPVKSSPIQNYPTTELSFGDQEFGGTTETITDYVPVAITTIGAIYDDESTTMTTASSRRFASEDSFERMAIVSGSSEESTLKPASNNIIENQSLHHPQQPVKKSRVSTTTVGGFKNRSDLGSREERRSKDGDHEISLSPKTLLPLSTEDDEREEEYYGYPPVFDTTMSNAIEDLGGATTVIEDTIPEESTSSPEVDSVSDPGLELEISDDERSTTDTNYIPEHDQEETTVGRIIYDDQATTEATLDHSSAETTYAASGLFSSLATQSSSEVPSTSTDPSSSTSSTTHNLEFIPFVEEDALVPFDNDTSTPFDTNPPISAHPSSHETDTFDKLTSFQDESLPLLKPLELKFFNGTTEESFAAQGSTETEDALPILVEKDMNNKPPTEFNLGNNNANAMPPGSSSLYSNGYYPHGSIIKDDDGPVDELHISEGEIPNKRRGSGKVSVDDLEETSTLPTSSTTLPTITSTSTKKAEPPLKAISSFDKFIPSYAPVTVSTNADGLESPHPSRTYSKFGIQDAPLYRYDHHNAPPLESNGFAYNSNKPSTSTAGIYHHRYYNEPEEIPSSRIQNPYNFYSTNTNPMPNQKHRGGQQGGMMMGGMLPHVYKNNQFFYEDSSGALDSYEEEYDTYLHPPTGGGNINSIASTPTSVVGPRFPSSSTPRTSPTSTSFQFLGERVRLPSYNQQRATSTPKYKYAHFNNQRGTTPYHKLITSTERSTVANSDYHHPRPFAAFPFSLPRSQDDNLLKNLGIKLSGCNVVGKMYSVGEVIEELSGDCLRCMCSDIGVHCAERKC